MIKIVYSHRVLRIFSEFFSIAFSYVGKNIGLKEKFCDILLAQNYIICTISSLKVIKI